MDVDFNPRSPYGERLCNSLKERGAKNISIHAPLTGSDVSDISSTTKGQDFNPRSPYGERPRGVGRPQRCQTFQSTLPLRGATEFSDHYRFLEDISIHAPLTGSDLLLDQRLRLLSNFNPRSPYGERPRQSCTLMRVSAISIHAPLTGSDTASAPVDYISGISIHAPLTGSDDHRNFRNKANFDFNPRSPYGERRSP